MWNHLGASSFIGVPRLFVLDSVSQDWFSLPPKPFGLPPASVNIISSLFDETLTLRTYSPFHKHSSTFSSVTLASLPFHVSTTCKSNFCTRKKILNETRDKTRKRINFRARLLTFPVFFLVPLYIIHSLSFNFLFPFLSFRFSRSAKYKRNCHNFLSSLPHCISPPSPMTCLRFAILLV